MASQAVQPAQPVAAAAAPASAASAASSAGAAGAGAGAGAGASSSSAAAFQPNAAQRHQLNEMRSLQALSSFERSNSAFCSQLYNTHSRMIEAVILQTMNDPNIEFAEKQPNNPAIKIAPMAWRFELFPATNKGGNQFTYSYDTDIPGTTYMMTPQPSFYLPKELKLGRNCREVRQLKKNAAIQLKNSLPDPAKMSFAESAAAASAPPPTVGGLGSFAEWVVDKLCDNELQHTMEASGVLNSWDEGSYLSVVKTDGDGNCLAHAVMTAAYGMSDSKGSLRDATFWEMSSAARKHKYLERYMYEQARQAATPGAVSSQAAVDKYLADKDNVAALTKEFERCTERLSNIKNYCEPIHIMVMAHVMRRPIIVYGSKHFGAKPAATTAPPEEEEEKKGGESGMVDATPAASSSSSSSSAAAAASSSSTAASSPLNSMVGIYLPIDWGSQHKYDQAASLDNPQLKPICLLYSCADEATGQGGHFSALTTTDDMLPCHGLVPLQQWDGYNSASKSCSTLSSAACATPGMDLGEPALPLLPLRFLLPHKHHLEGNFVHVLNKHMEITQTATGHWYAKMQLNKCMEYLKHGWQMYLQIAQTLWVTIDSGMPVLDNASPDAAMAAVLAESSKGEGGGLVDGGGVVDPSGGLGEMQSLALARLLQEQDMQAFSDADDLSVSPEYDDEDGDADDFLMPEVNEVFFLDLFKHPQAVLVSEERWMRPVRYEPPRFLQERRAELVRHTANPQFAPVFATLAITATHLLAALATLTTTRIDQARVLHACAAWAQFQHSRWLPVKKESAQAVIHGYAWHQQMWWAAFVLLPAAPAAETPLLSLDQVLSIAHVFNIQVDHMGCATSAYEMHPKDGLPTIDVLPAMPMWEGASDASKHIIAKHQALTNKRLQARLHQQQQQQQQKHVFTSDELRALLAGSLVTPSQRVAIEQLLANTIAAEQSLAMRGGLQRRTQHVQPQPQSPQQHQQQGTSPIAPQPVRASAVGPRVAQAIPINVNPQSVARAAAVAQATGQSSQQPQAGVVATAIPGSSAFRASAAHPSAAGSVAPVAAIAVPARPAHSRSNSEDVDEEAQLRQAMAMSMQADANEQQQQQQGGGGGGGGSEDGEVIEHADAVTPMQKEA